ncbi:flavin reductase [Gellertiella hungarica]|uniref:Cob(II)yrinic acid a,c-diamide reductase n=1 Tax=Gellertiella hungarica TaxID=1572859 RepID=A0A7W6NJQ1_9HYPH|nr:cob(II)yrinic acid a,c-diamide reductase [Gellertiella hungarica]
MDKHKVDAQIYRDAMARYAGHVQIVTTAMGEARRGVTITAACSVSDNPPTVLVCLNNGNPNNEIFFESGIFCLNSLGAGMQSLAEAFSGRNPLTAEERFALGQWKTLVTGAPVLETANVAFDCRVVDRKVTSTHTVLFGEVMAVHAGAADAALIYLDRGYRTL